MRLRRLSTRCFDLNGSGSFESNADLHQGRIHLNGELDDATCRARVHHPAQDSSEGLYIFTRDEKNLLTNLLISKSQEVRQNNAWTLADELAGACEGAMAHYDGLEET